MSEDEVMFDYDLSPGMDARLDFKPRTVEDLHKANDWLISRDFSGYLNDYDERTARLKAGFQKLGNKRVIMQHPDHLDMGWVSVSYEGPKTPRGPEWMKQLGIELQAIKDQQAWARFKQGFMLEYTGKSYMVMQYNDTAPSDIGVDRI